MKKVVVLGYGFIGRNLVKSYLPSDNIITVFDRKLCPAELEGRVRWVQGVFHDTGILAEAIKGAEIVYHLISSTVPADNVDESLELSHNVLDTIRLLKICIKEKVGQLIFFSSSSVYGPQVYLPISETASTNPISTHGIHKLTIEKYLQYYTYKYGIDTKIIRLSNPYGWGQNINGRQGFIAICLGKVLHQQDIVVMGDGSAIRDFIHIDDVIRACHLIADKSTRQSLFNIGTGHGSTLNSVFSELNYFFGSTTRIIYQATRKTDISASVLDVSKAKQELGFYPELSLKEGLRKTIKSYLNDYPALESMLIKKI